MFSLLLAAAAARGGGDVGVRDSGAGHERSAESRPVRRIRQDRDHRPVRRPGRPVRSLRDTEPKHTHTQQTSSSI